MKKNNYIFQVLAYCLISLSIIFTSTNSLAQPANDCCTGAIPLTVDATNTCVNTLGSNVAATDCMEATPTCALFAGGDTWYEVTVPASGEITIDLDVGDGTITDMGMSWYSGPCGTLTELECDDDDGAGLFPSITQTGLTPGDVIYVQVWEYNGGTEGDFNICAYEPPPPPPGDECADPIPYPGDVEAGTCVTDFDFSPFSGDGVLSPTPTCDLTGDAVVWFSWTAPIVTAAGDPLDLNFDDGDGQTNDCDIGIEFYEVDCATAAGSCLNNLSGIVTPLVQGTQYVMAVWDDGTPGATPCDFCLTVACSSPMATATAVCLPGDDSGFYVEVDVTNFGVGNTAYTVDIGGPQANITATGITTFGPFPNGIPVDVTLAGMEDATCGITITGLNKSCDIVTGITEGDTFCSSDAAVSATPIIPPDPGVTAVLTEEGTFDGEVGLGLYDGTWDDGSVIGLPPAGMGLFGTDTETSLEGATPNGGAGSFDPNVTTVGNFGDPAPIGASFTSGPLVDGNTYTLFIVDDFGDGWNGNNADLVDCEGNVILADLNQYIDAIAADDQDEVAWITFVYVAPLPTITWSGTGSVTDDPDGMPNSGDEVYTFDPSAVGAAGCDPVDVPLTMTVLFCGETCEETVAVSVSPPAQAPAVTLDDAVCNYTLTPACPDDVLTPATIPPAAPDEDPPALDIMVTTAGNCSGTFSVDPPACPPPGCMAAASAISTMDPTRICIDGVGDPINVTIDVDGGATGTWVITDAAGIILALPAGPPFDLDGSGAGQCLIWYINSDDAAFAPMVGDDASAVVAASSCAFLSNSITVDRIEVTAATISTTDPLTICIDDGIDEPINVTIDDAGIGANGAWVITDATGAIVALPAAPPFILDGAGVGTCSIWWVNYEDPAFAPAVGDDAAAIVAAATCAALSNSIEVIRETCEDPCGAAASTISTTDPTRICIDGVGDPINVTIDVDGGATGTWVITDATGIILALPAGPPFDLDGAGAGQCLIWYVNSDDAAFMPMVGDDAAAAVGASSCAFLSNSITVDRIEVTPAAISTTDPLTICIDDGVDEPINVTIDDAGIGTNGAWVITDATGAIVALPAAPPFILDGAGLGTCSIWWVNYDDPGFAPAIGDDAAAIVAAATCAALSNSIDIVREICDPCGATPSTISTTDPTRICIDGVGDPINVTIDVDGGATGTWVITDAAGIILALPAGPPFDLDGAGAGQCLIWYVNSNDAAFAPMVGDDAAAVVGASSCAFLSNSITVDRIEVTPAAISTTDPLTICIDDGVDEPINVTIDDAGIGTNGAWVITDATGAIVALPAAPPFILDGAGLGTCSIWWVNYDDPGFAPAVGDDAAAIVAAATCATLSNSIDIVREICDPCGATPSTISTTDPTRICIDGVGDPINVTIDADGGGTGTWVITDAAGIILALPPGPPFDLDGAGAGQCLIWYVNSNDAAFAPMVGDDAAAAVAASTCAFLSNAITVDRIEVSAATISSPQSPVVICTDDGMDEPVDVTIDDAGIGAMGAWVITDAAGTILALPPGPPFVLDGAGAGTCYIWWVNYDDPAFAPAVGDDANAAVVAATCAVLSNSVEVVREENCANPCEDPITGTVTTEETTCDLAGTMVEILDDMGNPVAGSPVTIAADGSYNLPGPFTCGTYTAQIVAGSAPQCYYDLEGQEGPFQFEVDGDGEADGVNFSTEPQVPTLSQWGLMILALMLMSFGAIKIGLPNITTSKKYLIS